MLTGNYWDGHLTLPFTLRDDPPRKVAMLGVAGGTVARAYAKYFPDTVIDAVEIDGELFDIGRRWFGLEDRPQLRVHADDARPFLRKTDERYDFIFLDTYRQPYIPFYLATKEFFAARPRPAGARAGRCSSTSGHPEGSDRLEQVLTATMGAAFAPRHPRPGDRHEHAADGQRRRSRRATACSPRRARCRPSCAGWRSPTRTGSRPPLHRRGRSTPTTGRRSSGSSTSR